MLVNLTTDMCGKFPTAGCLLPQSHFTVRKQLRRHLVRASRRDRVRRQRPYSRGNPLRHSTQKVSRGRL